MLVFDAQEHDFGAVSPGTEQLSHTFAVRNTGADAVQLRLKSLGCNCVSLDCPSSVAPGEAARIGVLVEIRNREGAFRTKATLETSDPALPTADLEVAFYAPPRIDVDPTSLQFGDVERGSKPERDLVISTRLEGESDDAPVPEVEIADAVLSCKHKDTRITTDSISGFQRAVHRFSVQLDTTGAPASEAPQFATLRFRAKEAPPGTGKAVQVEWAFAHNHWLKGPTATTLSRESDNRQVRVRLWSHDGKPFTLGKIVSGSSQVEARAASSEPATFQDVVITSAALKEKGADFSKGYIDVCHAEHPEEPYRLTVLVLP